jgi:hypothetical protein
MFEKIVFKNQSGYGDLLDIGAIAEALLFYGQVSIIANSATIYFILKKIPPFVLLDLVCNDRLNILYTEDQLAVSTIDRPTSLPLHSFSKFSSPQHTFDKIPFKCFFEKTNNRLASRKFANKIIQTNHDFFDQEAVLSTFENFQRDELSVDSIIHSLVPEYRQSDTIRFRLERENGGFIIDTNIDFIALNTAHHRLVPKEHSSITSAYLLSLFQDSQEELYFGGKLNSEIAVSSLSRKIHSQTVDSILNRSIKSESQIQAFSALTLESGHAIRESINNNKLAFSEVVGLLDKADKFRDWLKDQPTDEELIKNYYQATIKNSFVEKLPVKSIRWGVFTSAGLVVDSLGAGGLGTAIGTALGVFDTFILDKLIGGWRPHHFVEGELVKLLSNEDSENETLN